MFLEGDLQIAMSLQRHNLRLLVRLLTDHVLLTDHLVKIGTDALCQTCGEKERKFLPFDFLGGVQITRWLDQMSLDPNLCNLKSYVGCNHLLLYGSQEPLKDLTNYRDAHCTII